MDSKALYGKLSSLNLGRDGAKNDNEELLNILPSYQMYQSTVSRTLTPMADDNRLPSPMYELTPQSSATSQISNNPVDYFGSVVNSPAIEHEGFQFQASDDPSEQVRNNERLLENIHKLKRLTAITSDISKKLSVLIVLTKDIGKPGVKPTIVDPLTLELKQNDYIYGYVVVKNKTDQEIPFDMFLVVLEGNETFGASNKASALPPTKINRFLTMFDFNASWNDANLDRLATDHVDPRTPVLEIDPVDGCFVNLHAKKVFEPGTSYKKFFAFKLPESLLESSCEYGLVKHLQLPSTLGVCKNEMISVLRKKWKTGEQSGKAEHGRDPIGRQYASLTNDFSFPETSIDYSVTARIVGRASNYTSLLLRQNAAHGVPSDSEYVVVNEDFCFLRFVSHVNQMFELNRSLITEEAKLMHQNIVGKIKNALKSRQHELLPVPLNDAETGGFVPLEPTRSAAELTKMQQKYYTRSRSPSRKPADNIYENLSPYKKKGVFGATKTVGLVALSTPCRGYRADYVPPTEHIDVTNRKPPNTRIRIPFDLNFMPSEKGSGPPPDFKSISVELIVLSVKSKGLPMPVVIHPEMIFDNKAKGHESFDVNTIKTFQRYATDLSKILKNNTPNLLGLDRQVIQDIKCLANLSCKHEHLKVKGVVIENLRTGKKVEDLSAIPWDADNSSTSKSKMGEHSKYTKSFTLTVDTQKATPTASQSPHFCLTPCFQSCLLARLYYLKFNLKCPNGEKMLMRVPLLIQRED